MHSCTRFPLTVPAPNPAGYDCFHTVELQCTSCKCWLILTFQEVHFLGGECAIQLVSIA